MTESEARRVLGVDHAASMAHVRQAYLDLVKVWHPDRFEHDARLREKASQSMQRVNEAYAVLQRSADRPEPASPTSAPPPSAGPTAASSTNARASAASPVDSDDVAAAPPPIGPARVWLRRHRRDVFAAAAASIVGVVLVLALFVRSVDDEGPPAPEPGTTIASDVELPPSAPHSRAPVRRSEARPETGTDLRTGGPHGRAALSIQNRTASDVVVELTGEPDRRRALYVRGGEKITMLDLADGAYRVRLLMGRGWTGQSFSDAAGYRERRQPVQVEVSQRGAPLTAFTIESVSDELRSIPAFRLD